MDEIQIYFSSIVNDYVKLTKAVDDPYDTIGINMMGIFRTHPYEPRFLTI